MKLEVRTDTLSTRRHGGLLAALMASVAMAGLILPVTGWAQPANTQATRPFNIPAQALTDALVQFGYQSGLQVAADGGVAASVRSTAISGSYAPADALSRMLAGTGLTFQYTGATTIQVQRIAAGSSGAIQLDPVQVHAFAVPPQALIDNIPPPYAGGQVATGGQLGLLGNRGVMDTPFNQTSYTSKKAQDQQARTVRDVLADDPSVRTSIQDGRTGGDNVFIRGFPVTSLSYTLNGLYGILPTYSTMAEFAERVEVLRGPTAMLSGMAPESTIGGVINIVPKRAPNEGITQATANYLSSGQVGGHVDIGRRMGNDNQFGVRFNGVFRAGQTAVENNTDQRQLTSLGLDYRGERVRLSADLGYQYQYIGGMIPYVALANNVPLPWAPDARKNFGQLWNYQYRKDLFGVARAEFDLTENATVYAAFGAHDNRVESLRAGVNVLVNNFNGNGSTTPSNLSQWQMYQTAEAGLRANFDTGPIGHKFALTATTFAWQSGFGLVNGTPFNTSIYTPTNVPQPGLATAAAPRTSTTTLSGIAAADTFSAANDRVQLTVGARLQQVSAQNYNLAGMATSSYDESALSPSVSLVVKPFWENVSFYANYIQGLQQGAIVSNAFANAGQVFPPYKSTQYEAGVKVDWGRLTTTASLFQISQPSILTNVANNTQFLGGQQVNQGLEFNFFGEVSEGVRVLGGAMLLNAVLTQTQGGLSNGWIAPFSPTAQFNLGSEWDLPFARGLTLDGRVVYTGSQFIDTTTPRRSLPEWVRFDVGARYTFENAPVTKRPVTLRFAVENVLDANYWAGGTGPTTLSVGMPRIFKLALTSDF